jgi:hypothetical protein
VQITGGRDRAPLNNNTRLAFSPRGRQAELGHQIDNRIQLPIISVSQHGINSSSVSLQKKQRKGTAMPHGSYIAGNYTFGLM